MGASEWTYFVAYRADVERALQELRSSVFERESYYKPSTFIAKYLKSGAGQSASEAQRASLRRQLASMWNEPAPQSIDELVARRAEAGTHSILDVDSVADEPGFRIAAPLSDQELTDLFGTTEPTHAMVEAQLPAILALRQRWYGTYLIVYDDEGTPREICFTGFSGD